MPNNSSQTSSDDGSYLTVSPGPPQGDQAAVRRSPHTLTDYVPPPPTTHSPHMSPVILPRSPQTGQAYLNSDNLLISTSTEASFQSLGAAASQSTTENDHPFTYEEMSREKEYTRQQQLEAQQQQQQHEKQPLPYPIPGSNNSTSTIVEVMPTATQPYNNGDVTFVPCEPLEINEYSRGRYTFSIFLFNVRDYRKKESYIVLVLALAVVLGVLGGTVWNKSSSGSDTSTGNTNTGSSTTNWPGRATSTTTFIGSLPTPSQISVAPTSTTSTSAAPAPSSPSGGVPQCNINCGTVSNSCQDSCELNDATLKSCLAACPATGSCVNLCRLDNPCLQTCSSSWNSCISACPH